MGHVITDTGKGFVAYCCVSGVNITQHKWMYGYLLFQWNPCAASCTMNE